MRMFLFTDASIKSFDDGKRSQASLGEADCSCPHRDLGFTDADRVENVRRIAETAKLAGYSSQY